MDFTKTKIVRCPNCGNLGERYYCPENRLVRTSCNHCDYLLVQCSDTSRVIEAYAPGINSYALMSVS